MRAAQGIGLGGEPAPGAELGRQRLDRVGGPVERLPRPLAQAVAPTGVALALCTGTIPVVCSPAGPDPARPPATTSCVATRKPERSSLPLSSSRVPGCRRSAR